MASKNAAIKVPISDVVKRFAVRIEVTGIKRQSLRIRIGGWFFVAGARIIGMPVKVLFVDDE